MQGAPIFEKAADETPVKKSLQSDTNPLEALFRRYQHWVYNLVMRMEEVPPP
jgi:hypothetical protein